MKKLASSGRGTNAPGPAAIENRGSTAISARNASDGLGNRDNLLLAALPAHERKRLQPFLQHTDMGLGEELIRANETIRNVFFPINMISSTLQELSDGSSIEVGLMGVEGMIGIQFWLKQRTTPSRTIVQVAGTSYRMSAETFKKEVMDKDSPLNSLIASYTHAFLNMTAQTSACNRLHEVETRLARWLSLIYDRRLERDFQLRQEFLAQMLGVHRPSVTIAANSLQKAGLISYTRGNMHIEDPIALRDSACECYGIIEAQFDRMLGKGWRECTQMARLHAQNS
jgi:CRP-like cAMP-binding protein